MSSFRNPAKLSGLLLLAVLTCLSVVAQDRVTVVNGDHLAGSLSELRNKHRALLVVFKSRVVDANNSERAIVEDVLRADPEPKGHYQWVYGQLARKLNAYIRKYRSLTAARELAEADYVIFFNVVEYRRILNIPYPYGELFVIVKGTPETQSPPRVVWRAKKVLWASDAINDLIKELKAVRGET